MRRRTSKAINQGKREKTIKKSTFLSKNFANPKKVPTFANHLRKTPLLWFVNEGLLNNPASLAQLARARDL